MKFDLQHRRRLSEAAKRSWADPRRKKRSCRKLSHRQKFPNLSPQKDFLDEVEAARTKRNQKFPGLVKQAQARQKANGQAIHEVIQRMNEEKLIACAIWLGYPRAIQILKSQTAELLEDLKQVFVSPIGEWRKKLDKLVAKGLPPEMMQELMSTPLYKL